MVYIDQLALSSKWRSCLSLGGTYKKINFEIAWYENLNGTL